MRDSAGARASSGATRSWVSRRLTPLRPAFFPFAVAATAILAVNNLLLALKLWPAGHVIIPSVALCLLVVATVLWLRSS